MEFTEPTYIAAMRTLDELMGLQRSSKVLHGWWFGLPVVILIVKYAGKDWIDKVLPPIVVGPIIMVIGFEPCSQCSQ